MRYRKALWTVILIVCLSMMGHGQSQAEDIPAEEMKNAVVEVQVGFVMQDGMFYPMKHASGCILANSEDGVYVVTTNHTVSITDKEKKRYCRKKNIKMDYSMSTAIRLAVKGDVMTEADIVASSQEYDFCILSSDDVLQEKGYFSLSSAAAISTGDSVCTLGFGKGSKGASRTYGSEEVEIGSGIVLHVADADADTRRKREYIRHTGIVTAGNSGGALLSEDGYLIGMNNSSIRRSRKDDHYSLSVDEIREVLDNYGIYYRSKGDLEAYEKFRELYDRCEALCADTGYEAGTRDALAVVLQEVKPILEETQYDPARISEAMEMLEEARQSLKEKSPRIRIVIIILGIVIAGLSVNLLRVCLWIRGNKASQEMMQQAYGTPSDGTDNGMPGGNRRRNLIRYRAGLKREKNGKVILLNYDSFIIGKSVGKSDYTIADNSAISRQHAKITRKNGNYYIQDMGSANGTYVNGQENNGAETLLKDHDKILLADEMFEFIEKM